MLGLLGAMMVSPADMIAVLFAVEMSRVRDARHADRDVVVEERDGGRSVAHLRERAEWRKIGELWESGGDGRDLVWHQRGL